MSKILARHAEHYTGLTGSDSTVQAVLLLQFSRFVLSECLKQWNM